MAFQRVLDQLLFPILMLFILAGSVGGFLLGCALLVRAEAAVRFMQSMNRWISTRRATRELEVPRESLAPSKWLALFLVAGGALAGYFLLVRVQVPRGALSAGDPRFATALAVESAKWLLVAGCAVSVAIGLLTFAAPRLLGALQERMNRWVSTRTLLPADSERMRTPLDLLVEAHPRAAGALIGASSLAIAVAMALLIAARWLR